MKSFSTLTLEYDGPDCAASTEVEIGMPELGEGKTTSFACKECGQKSKMTVSLEADDQKKKEAPDAN